MKKNKSARRNRHSRSERARENVRRNTAIPEGYDTFLLGEDERCHISTDCKATQLNNNIMVVGGSGAGKTMSVMLPILLHMERSNAVGVFTKWGMLSEVTRLLKKRGYAVHVLNFVEPEKSEYGFDPLFYCKSDEDIRDLAHSIIYSDPNSGCSREPFWETSAENLSDVVMRTTKKYAVKGKATMGTALSLLDRLEWSHDKDWNDWDDDENREDYPTHYIIEKFSKSDPDVRISWRAFTNLSDQTGSSVAVSMHTPMSAVFPSAVRRCVCNSKQFNFSELLKPKTVLLVYVSPVNVAVHRFATLFYRQLFKTLFELAERREDKVLPYPVHVLCDDFATGGRIADFDHYISIFREKRISATLLLQSESQLSSIYGQEKARTIINNCDTYVFLGGMDDETCVNIAQKVNVPVDEIRNMPLGSEYFIRRGQKPIYTKRYNILEDPEYQKLQALGGKKLEFQATAPLLSGKTADELYSLFGIEIPQKEPSKNQGVRPRADYWKHKL